MYKQKGYNTVTHQNEKCAKAQSKEGEENDQGARYSNSCKYL